MLMMVMIMMTMMMIMMMTMMIATTNKFTSSARGSTNYSLHEMKTRCRSARPQKYLVPNSSMSNCFFASLRCRMLTATLLLLLLSRTGRSSLVAYGG